MGKLFKGSTSTTTTKAPYEQNPWEPQQPYLKEGFEAASGALDTAMGGVPKDLVANMTGGQTQDLGALSSAGRDFSGTAAGQVTDATKAMNGITMGTPSANPMADRFDANTGTIMRNASDRTALDNATGILNRIGGTNYSGKADSIYRTAGQEGMEASRALLGLAAEGPVNSRAAQTYDDVSSDMTQTVANNAGTFVNNDLLQGQIDAANRDVVRAFQGEQANINSAAVGSGGVNSTRAGAMEAIAQRGAMDRAADTAAQIRGDAYGRALTLAQQNEATRRDGALSANSQLQQDDEYRLRANLGAAGQLTSAEQARDSARLNASGQLIDGAATKTDAALRANDQVLDAQNSRVGNQIAANSQVGQGADRLEDRTNATFDRYASAQDIGMKGYEGQIQGLLDSLQSGDRTQAQAQAEIEGVLKQSGLPLDYVQQFMQAIGGNFGSQGYQTNVSTQQNPSVFQQITGAAATAAGAWGGRG